MNAQWPFRLGMTIALLLGSTLAGFAFWFQLGGWYWLIAPAAYLAWAWWGKQPLAHVLAAPAIFWIALLWGVFPALGVNAVPNTVVELGKSQAIAMFDGPQPAMLPILSAQTHRQYSRLDKFDLSELSATKTPVFVEDKDLARFQASVSSSNFTAKSLGSYQTLASHGSGLRFAKVGATTDDWNTALATRSLESLMTTVRWFEISQP
jgi:hypothetical protein